MDNNQIKNPKVEVQTGNSLNEKDYMTLILSTLKDIEKNMTVALTEASNETLFNEYKEIFDSYANMQREVYEEMFRKGWYSLEKAEDKKIVNKLNMLNKEFTDLSN